MRSRVFVLKSELEFENIWSISRNAGNLWWIIFSNITLRFGSSDIGLKLLQFSLPSFLNSDITVFLIEFGNLPIEKLMLIIWLGGFASSFLDFFSIFNAGIKLSNSELRIMNRFLHYQNQNDEKNDEPLIRHADQKK